MSGVLIVLGVVAVFVVYVALQPAAFRITRSALIAATPAALFAQVNDFHRWAAWSPWARLDLTAKNVFEGPVEGVGAGFRWDGNKKVGTGAMTIIESRPGELIRIRLEFLKPFAATNITEFTFVPAGGQTQVTWTMTGVNTFIAKAVGVFMNCDKMVGGMFEEGLENLRIVTTR